MSRFDWRQILAARIVNQKVKIWLTALAILLLLAVGYLSMALAIVLNSHPGDFLYTAKPFVQTRLFGYSPAELIADRTRSTVALAVKQRCAQSVLAYYDLVNQLKSTELNPVYTYSQLLPLEELTTGCTVDPAANTLPTVVAAINWPVNVRAPIVIDFKDFITRKKFELYKLQLTSSSDLTQAQIDLEGSLLSELEMLLRFASTTSDSRERIRAVDEAYLLTQIIDSYLASNEVDLTAYYLRINTICALKTLSICSTDRLLTNINSAEAQTSPVRKLSVIRQIYLEYLTYAIYGEAED